MGRLHRVVRWATWLLAICVCGAQAQQADWTLLVYLDGDNNLEPFALSDLEEMEAGHPGDGVEVLVLVDRAKGYTADWGDWTGARLYRVRPDRNLGLASELLDDLGEINMGDPDVLEAFVRDGLARFPARRTGLVFWNHGGGWSNLVNDEDAPGAEGGHDYLTLPELRSATRSALDAASLPRLDLIGFDMCLMGQLETVEAVSTVATHLVASQAIEPGDGWPWNRVLALLDGQRATADVATGIVDVFDAFYRARNEPVTTLAAYDLTHGEATLDALDRFADTLAVRAPQRWREIVRSLFYAESYNELGDTKRGAAALQSVDLRHALANIVEMDASLARDADYRALTDALDRLVLSSRNSAQHRLSTGVAIYAPFRGNLYNPAYAETGLGARNAWSRLLSTLHENQRAAPARLEIPRITNWNDYRGEAVPDLVHLGQDGFLAQVRAQNALRVLWWLGERDREGGLLLYDKDTANFGATADYERTERPSRMETVAAYAVPDGSSEIYSRYDGTRLVVTNGSETGVATIDRSDIEAREHGLHFVEVIYEHPDDGRFEGTLRFDWLWQADSLVLALPQQDGNYAYRSISPRPDATLHLLADRYAADGTLSKVIASSLTWGDGLQLTLELVSPGDYGALVGLEDLGGNVEFRHHDFRVSPRNDGMVERMNLADLTAPNLTGEWHVIDARAWYEQGRLVPNGAKIRYAPLDDLPSVLVKEVFDERGARITPEGTVDVIARAGLAHLRTYVLDPEGYPDPGWGARVGAPYLERTPQGVILASMDLSDGSVGVAVKRSGPEPVLATPVPAVQGPSAGGFGAPLAPQQSSFGAGAEAALQGAWQSFDGTGLVFEGNQWLLYEGGMTSDGGVFQVQGDILQTQSQISGQLMNYRFQASGQSLVVQDSFGQVFQFQRVQ